MQLAVEGLLSRLVPEKRAPGICPANPAKECQIEQSRFRNATRPVFRQRLVDPERRKACEIHCEKRSDDAGRIKQPMKIDHPRKVACKAVGKLNSSGPSPNSMLFLGPIMKYP